MIELMIPSPVRTPTTLQLLPAICHLGRQMLEAPSFSPKIIEKNPKKRAAGGSEFSSWSGRGWSKVAD